MPHHYYFVEATATVEESDIEGPGASTSSDESSPSTSPSPTAEVDESKKGKTLPDKDGNSGSSGDKKLPDKHGKTLPEKKPDDKDGNPGSSGDGNHSSSNVPPRGRGILMGPPRVPPPPLPCAPPLRIPPTPR